MHDDFDSNVVAILRGDDVSCWVTQSPMKRRGEGRAGMPTGWASSWGSIDHEGDDSESGYGVIDGGDI